MKRIRTFFVREVGRGRSVIERSLEIAEVLRGGGRQESGFTYFGKNVRESLSRLSIDEFKLATNSAEHLA